ncbi:Protein GVQW1 [Plecturocebus cupreus]
MISLVLLYRLEGNLSSLQASPHRFKQFFCLSIPKTGFHHVGKAGLKLLTSGDLPILTSQSAGIIGTGSQSADQARVWWYNHSSLQSQTLGFKQSSSLSLLSSWDYTWSHYVVQASLKLLASSDPLTSASQNVGITGMSHCTWPNYICDLLLQKQAAQLQRRQPDLPICRVHQGKPCTPRVECPAAQGSCLSMSRVGHITRPDGVLHSLGPSDDVSLPTPPSPSTSIPYLQLPPPILPWATGDVGRSDKHRQSQQREGRVWKEKKEGYQVAGGSMPGTEEKDVSRAASRLHELLVLRNPAECGFLNLSHHFLVEIGFPHVSQARLDLLSFPKCWASQSAGITGVSHHAWPLLATAVMTGCCWCHNLSQSSP